MGLFDELTCDYGMPRRDFQGRTCQTKSFPDPYLNHYRLTADGQLERLEYDTEQVEREPGDPLRGLPLFRRVNQCWVPCDYTGEIRFCDFEKPGDYVTSKLVGFVVWLESGRVARGPVEAAT